jgi:alpha-L-rhamnosidase
MSHTISKWMWYYGDFERYHSLKLHLRRMEREVTFPAFWHLPEYYHNIRFRKSVTLDKKEEIYVTANGVGFVQIENTKYAFESKIPLSQGKYDITIIVSNLSGLPSAYVEGDTIKSDESWMADCYNERWKHVGCNNLYTDKAANPDTFHFEYQKILPALITTKNGGVLYDFGKETFAKIVFKRLKKKISLYFGETEQEAVDTDFSYLFEHVTPGSTDQTLEAKGFRYLYIPDVSEDEIAFEAFYEYLPFKQKGTFQCSDDRINRIWEIASDTFALNSREFYLDGIKRDRWVWSGDSYQSYFINRYLFFDEDIARRTIVALGGKGEVEQHINTIMDYSFYWLISVYDYYEMTGDMGFVKDIFHRMKAVMDFCISRLDDNGFARKIGADWIFIDWADIDKTGAVCAQQMLLLKSIESYIECAKLIGEEYSAYSERFGTLKQSINDYYWDEQKGAFIDSFESGKRNVTRHANIFALLFGYADEKQRESIIDHVLLNDEITQIKTPYFKFYELEALCHIGKTDTVIKRMKEYWGEMIDAGATSFWEEFTVGIPWQEQLGMYGMKYGKSLCHAWGASPIYLLGRYFLGIRPTAPGYEAFEVHPMLDFFQWVEAEIPVKNGMVSIEKRDSVLKVTADRDGGVLIYHSKKHLLKAHETITIND